MVHIVNLAGSVYGVSPIAPITPQVLQCIDHSSACVLESQSSASLIASNLKSFEHSCTRKK